MSARKNKKKHRISGCRSLLASPCTAAVSCCRCNALAEAKPEVIRAGLASSETWKRWAASYKVLNDSKLGPCPLAGEGILLSLTAAAGQAVTTAALQVPRAPESQLWAVVFWEDARIKVPPAFAVLPAEAATCETIVGERASLQATYALVGQIDDDQVLELQTEAAQQVLAAFQMVGGAKRQQPWVKWARRIKERYSPLGLIGEVLNQIASTKLVLDSPQVSPPVDCPPPDGSPPPILAIVDKILSYEKDVFQQELSEFIRDENARLDRLIMNLYSLFTLDGRRERDMFLSACHSIAEYFHADDASILLAAHQPQSGDTTSSPIATTLRLVGTFGAWERAMHSPFVRRWQPLEYPAPEQVLAVSGNTTYFWITEDPVRFAHRGQLLKGDSAKQRKKAAAHETIAADAPYYQVWLNKSLGTACRNILAVSLRRPTLDETRLGSLGEGVLKVENRRPFGIPTFGEGHEAEMLLGEFWSITAVRPYLHYLKRHSPDHQHVVNEVGWRRMFDAFALDTQLFEQIRSRWYEFRRKTQNKKQVVQVTRALGEITAQLDELLRFITIAESFLQHFQHVLRHLCGLARSPGDSTARNVPSLFNIVNLCSVFARNEDAASLRRQQLLQSLLGMFFGEANKPDCELQAISADGDGHCLEPFVQKVMCQVRQHFLAPLIGQEHSIGNAQSVREYVTSQVSKALIVAFEGRAPQLEFHCQAGLEQLQLLLGLLAQHMQTCATDALASAKIPGREWTMSLEEEYRRLRRCAIQTRQKFVSGQADAGRAAAAPSWQQPQRESDDTLEESVAAMLAEGAMHAHTFAQVDEARMLFVSRRVWQLLANRVVAMAQRHDLELTHEHVWLFQLDDFAINNLLKFQRGMTVAADFLKRAVEIWCGLDRNSTQQSAPQVSVQSLRIGQMLEEATGIVNSSRSAGKRLVLLTVRCNGAISVVELLKELGLPKLNQQLDTELLPWTIQLSARQSGSEAEAIAFDLLLQLPPGKDGYEDSHWIWAIAESMTKLGESLEKWCRDKEANPSRKSRSLSRHLKQAGSHHAKKPPPRLQPAASPAASVTQGTDWRSRLKSLRRALDAIIIQVSQADSSKDLFGQIRGKLHNLCESIAGIVEADSAAVFFETDHGKMVMQGACGRVGDTLNLSQRTTPGADIPGVEYSSKWEAAIASKTRGEWEPEVRRTWPLTNQIWHLGEGRIAYSREQFKNMRPGKGVGDEFAYPPDYNLQEGKPTDWTLQHVFRTFIGIPIFARGGRTDFVGQPGDAGSAVRTEFHSQHRVVGILKLEGKHPKFDLAVDDAWWDSLSPRCLDKLFKCSGSKPKGIEDLKKLYRGESLGDRGKELLTIDVAGGKKEVDSELIDELTLALDARWEPHDVELLVAVAMEIGRLLTLFTMNKATKKNIFLGESDVGILDIRHQDIDALVACKSIAKKVCRKVEFELNCIQSDLEREQRFLSGAGSSADAPSHRPIREIEVRPKRDASLFAKLVGKKMQNFNQWWRRTLSSGPNDPPPRAGRLELGKFAVELPDHGFESNGNVVRGHVDLHAMPGDAGNYVLDYIGGDLFVGNRKLRVVSNEDQASDTELPFCRRIFARSAFALDDWAGGRVKCGFLSDISLLTDAIFARFPERRIVVDPQRIQSWLEAPQPNGYRAVHITVYVPISSIATEDETKLVQSILPQFNLNQNVKGEPCFPCEIQIRTAYQSSWAEASHDIQYKIADVHYDLRRYMSYLSGLLAESDKIMEVVRERIEATDPQLLDLLLTLRQSFSAEDFAKVQFSAFAAQYIHQHHRLYGGRPHFSRLVDVASRLVKAFDMYIPGLIQVAFLQDFAMHNDPSDSPKSIQKALESRVQGCITSDESGFLQRLSLQIPRQTKRDDLMGSLPPWCWKLLETFQQAQQEREDPAARLRDSYAEYIESQTQRRLELLKTAAQAATGATAPATRNTAQSQSHREAYQLRRAGCYLETALQLSRLQELPDEPLRSRAIEEFGAIYRVLQEIRNWVGGDVCEVLQHAEHELRSVAARLDTPVPTNLSY